MASHESDIHIGIDNDGNDNDDVGNVNDGNMNDGIVNDERSVNIGGRDLNRQYASEIKLATQHIRNDLKRVTLTPKSMIYAAVTIEGRYNSSTRPITARGGKLAAPSLGGMCSISGPHPTPMDEEEVAKLLGNLFAKVKAGINKYSKTDTRTRLTARLIRQKTANTRKIIPNFDPYAVLRPHIATMMVYLDEAVYPSKGIFPDKLLPFLVVYFDINAKPPRCNYEILTINAPQT